MKTFLIDIEPNFINEPVAWVAWNMKTYDNTLADALALLKQRETIGKFLLPTTTYMRTSKN